MNEIMRLIKENNLTIIDQQFDNDCAIKVSIRKMEVNMVLAKLDKLEGVAVKYEYSA